MKNPGLKEEIILNDVLKEAKKMNPTLKLPEQLKFYNGVQEKVISFTSNFNTSDVAFSKKQLSMLMLDVFEPQYEWETNQFLEQN